MGTAVINLLLLAAALVAGPAAATNPADQAVLDDIRKSLTNADALGWPKAGGGDACAWPHVSCDQSGRVDNLDLKSGGLAGRLPASISSLTALEDLSLQGNSLSGPLPSFRGMATLQHVFLNDNAFDAIPADFFQGLDALLEISIANNPLNTSSGGWALSNDLASSSQQLQSLQLDNCSLIGAIPDFLGTMTSLQTLSLTYNNLSGPIPASFNGSGVQSLRLNNQRGDKKLSGPLHVIATMTNLQVLWLHGNEFTGPIPDGIGACKDLTSLRLNSNMLVGLVPPSLGTIHHLHELQLDNNNLLGAVPPLKVANFTFSANEFCAPKPGDTCSPEVMALLQFLAQLQYPTRLVSSWSGNDPCVGWLGVTCAQAKVTVLNLPGSGFNGTISQSLGYLSTLTNIKLAGNHLTGRVPDSLTKLGSLQELDLSMNDLSGPLPTFSPSVKVNVTGNLNFNSTGKITSTDSGPAGAAAAGGAPARSAAAAAAGALGGVPESVTVACPDHLVIADLPVAKSLGAVTTSAAAATGTIGRRSRRPLGERVHICSRCEFPISIYGRLIPCEHAFCLTCARSDSSCYLCDERIQKIQSMKMMEGIFICAAPMCLKSFLKKADFESHVPEAHANLLQTNVEKEERNESDAPNISCASAGDTQRQSQMPEMSTARAPPRPGVSPTSASHMQDREERSRYHQSGEQTPLRPQMLAKPPSFHGRHSYPPGDTQAENNPPQGFDRPYNWSSQSHQENPGAGTPLRQESDHSTQDKQQMMPNAPFMFPPIPHQPNFMMPMNMNQPLMPNASFNYPPLQQDGNSQYFGTPFQMQLPDAGSDQGSMSGIQPSPGPLSFPEGLQRPWPMGLMGNPFQSMALGQGMADGSGDPQGVGGMAFMQAGFGGIPDGSMNPGMPGQADRGILAQMPMPMQMQMSLPPPPPPTQPPSGAQQSFKMT